MFFKHKKCARTECAKEQNVFYLERCIEDKKTIQKKTEQKQMHMKNAQHVHKKCEKTHAKNEHFLNMKKCARMECFLITNWPRRQKNHLFKEKTVKKWMI